MSPDRNIQAELRGELRVDAKEAADILKITPMVEKLRAVKQSGIVDPDSLSRPLQQARFLCLWKIWQANEEVRRAVGQIDFDLADANTLLSELTSKRQATINMINTMNFMQGGVLGVIKQSLGLQHDIPQPPKQEIAMTSFGTGTALALVTLLIPSYFSRKIDAPPNTLSQILNPGYAPSDASQSYLWQFLTSTPEGSQLTRRQILTYHWRDFAGLKINDATVVRKISSAPESDEKLREGIRTVGQRIALLHDLKTHIEEFDGCLYELHQAVTFR